jgi:hypothetical protein
MEQRSSTRQSRPVLAAIVTVATILGGAGLIITLQDSGISLSAHDGPKSMTTLGLVRFQSCKYQGAFVGGAGYDCVVKNVSRDDPRGTSNVRCAGFDAGDRMIGGPSLANELYGQVMGPGEERVIRLYLPENASVAVCSETGDVISPSRLQGLIGELTKSNLIAEIPL